MNKQTDKVFPSDFLFGVAVSSYQTEGNNTNSDWWEWEQLHAGTSNGPEEKSEGACNSYVEYQKDIDLAKSLGLTCYRLSVEWARIEPEKGKYDHEVLTHYAKVLTELKNNGFTVFLTLSHFTVPIWFKNQNGWESEESVNLFSNFARVCATSFGQNVDYWTTFNEPMVSIGEGYTNGHWPPNKSSKIAALKVFITIIKAHKAAYKSIKDLHRDARIGIVQHVTQFSAKTANPIDILACKMLNFFSQKLLFALLNSYSDYLGINYYTEYLVENLKLSQDTSHGKSDLHNWAISPNGLYLILKNLMTYKKPIFITENGIATTNEKLRISFIEGHLKAILQASQEGVDVKGYMYWSLLDNFEWAQGYRMKFGLVAVDRNNNYERILKESAHYYSEICRLRKISDIAG